jgi:hypothetical protein
VVSLSSQFRFQAPVPRPAFPIKSTTFLFIPVALPRSTFERRPRAVPLTRVRKPSRGSDGTRFQRDFELGSNPRRGAPRGRSVANSGAKAQVMLSLTPRSRDNKKLSTKERRRNVAAVRRAPRISRQVAGTSRDAAELGRRTTKRSWDREPAAPPSPACARNCEK